MSVIYADTNFGVSTAASPAQNATNLNAAIAAAAVAQTALILPAGDIQYDSDLVLPKGFIGAVAIFGIADKISRLVPVGGCNGINFDLSSGDKASNSATLKDFGLVAKAGNAGTALKLSYGSSSLGSVENQPGSKIENISIYGGGWTNGVILQECWHLRVEDLYMYGNMGTYTKGSTLGKGDGGPGSGVGLSVWSGVNNTFEGIVAEFFGQGVTTTNDGHAGGDCQGLVFNDIQMVECVEGFHLYGGVGGYLTTIEISDWMVDNGNINVPGHASIIVENGTSIFIEEGQGLQNGGAAPNITLLNCVRSWIKDASLEFRANTTGPDVLVTGNSSANEISDNVFGGTLQFDKGTTGNLYGNNRGATIVDNGTNIPLSSTAAQGGNGWTPVLALVPNGSGGTVVEVQSWTGGAGTPPTSPVYIGSAGFVSTPASAVTVNGPKGDPGPKGGFSLF